ncbi:unnamed protein product [Closterium sp. NIES-53]
MPRAQRESGRKVKVMCIENGAEFIGAYFEGKLKRKGIQHQLMVPYNLQKNSVAERFNRTLQEGARTLLGLAGLPDPFWVTALRQVTLVKNRVLATVGDKQWVPYTKWYGSAPAVNMLRAYGCMVVFHQQRQKLPTIPLIIEADEVQRPSRQVQVTVSEEEIYGVTEDGGEPEVEEQQQQQQQYAPIRDQRPHDRPRRDVCPPNRLTYPSAEGDCYLYMPPDPGIEAAALGARESALSLTAPAEALHTFTLDSGASRCFFRNSTTAVTPLPARVAARLADPSGGPVLARSSTVLPCPAVPSGSLSGLHHFSFSTSLCMSICTCTQMGRHLAPFTRRPGSSLYTLTTELPRVAASVCASGQLVAPCSSHALSHQTLFWHHRLGHPSLPRLRGMHSCLLDSGFPRSLPPLSPSPAPPCLPCVGGSSAPLLTSPRFPRRLLPYRHVPDILIPWIRAVRLQLPEPFDTDLPVLHLHSVRGGEFASDLLRDFCRGEGIVVQDPSL